jgi:hypothetical protein
MTLGHEGTARLSPDEFGHNLGGSQPNDEGSNGTTTARWTPAGHCGRVWLRLDGTQADDNGNVERDGERLEWAVTLTLQQAGTQVTGNGSLVGSNGSAALTVTGSFSAPNMSLTITSPGFESITYAGTVTGNTMTGTMNGSGFVNVAMTMTTQ